MSAGTTVRFAAEFDDTELTRGLNSAKSSITSLTTNIEPISLFDAATLQDLDKLEQSTNALEQSFTGLDSASTGIGGTFEEIGNAANQAGDNFNTLGTSGATVEQQLAAIGTTSTTAGQSMSALGGSADTTATSMGALTSNFEGVSGGLTDTNTLFGKTTGAMADVGDQAKDTGSTMSEIWGKGGMIAIGISATISGIANLIRGFRDYGDAQVKVNQKTLALSKANEAVTKAQDAYNAAVAKYGKNSGEAQKALLDLGQAQLNQSNKQDALALAIKRLADAQTNTWLGIAGTVTGVGGSIMQVLTGIGGEKGLGGLGTKFTEFKTKVGSTITALGGFGTLAATGFGIGAAIVIIAQTEDALGRLKAAGLEFTRGTNILDFSKFKLSMEEYNEVVRVTGMSLAQIMLYPEEAGRKFVAMGGKIDSNGKIIVSAQSKIVSLMDSVKEAGVAAEEGTPPLIAFFQTIAKGVSGLLNLGNGVKSANTALQAYIPTVEHLTTSSRSVWKEGAMVTETYTMGVRALNMYGVEQQKTSKTILDSYEAFKKATQAQGPFASATQKSGGAVHSAAIGIGEAAFRLLSFDDKLKYLSEQGMPLATEATNTFGDALTAGNVKFQDLEQTTQDGIVTEQRYREQLLLHIKDTTTRANAINLTTSQLELQYKAEQGNTEAIKELNKQVAEAAKKQRELRDAMAESVNAFSDITGALTQEDFTKAFKEFKETMKDLIPKETMNNVKTFFQDLQTNSQGLGKVSKAIDVLFAAITTGTDKLSSQDLKGIIGGMSNELERMAAINPRAAAVNKLLFEPLQKLDGSALTSKISQIGDAIMIAKDAMDKGWITADAYTDIVAALATSSDKVVTPLGKIGPAADKASGGLNKTGESGSTAAPKLDLVAEALNSVILAGEDVGRRLAAVRYDFAPPNIKPATDAILKIAKAADTLINGINKAKISITVNNSQALASINAVVNAQGKIKNILQVIKGDNHDALNKINQVVNAQGKIKNITQTITTVYKTVGTKATNTRVGVGTNSIATNSRITGGVEGAGAISVAPLIGGGSSSMNMSNFNGGGGTGDVNVTIINRDEFGTEKIRKYKAVLGKDRYVFGSVGAGG